MDVNANDASSLSKSRKKVVFKEIKGGDRSNAVTSSSSLMLSSCAEQEEEAGDESLSFALSQNSELENEE